MPCEILVGDNCSSWLVVDFVSVVGGAPELSAMAGILQNIPVRSDRQIRLNGCRCAELGSRIAVPSEHEQRTWPAMRSAGSASIGVYAGSMQHAHEARHFSASRLTADCIFYFYLIHG